jgi:GTPase SAR1 family protein
VVLVCGPPGAGKTTLARSLGLDVYDLDDEQWAGSERVFRAALRRVGADPAARAVVVRSGATRAARLRTALVVQATELRVLAVEARTCARRVVTRARPHPPLEAQLAAVGQWWQVYEPVLDGELGLLDRSGHTSESW